LILTIAPRVSTTADRADGAAFAAAKMGQRQMTP
jgi:hypothetical protein